MCPKIYKIENNRSRLEINFFNRLLFLCKNVIKYIYSDTNYKKATYKINFWGTPHFLCVAFYFYIKKDSNSVKEYKLLSFFNYIVERHNN
ncbi:hypothetical protein CNEO3_1250002 [Clostridium neonatale]|uniref:Uncharacterized protein n=1 Tax=Siphoviridae sp. ct3gT1 TaxID=2825323 RepID=A0A8S5UJB1_9CAUD|nr:hypothetical protein CNEO3_1060002 [Clostridium neonatale]CAI3548672.1 hypothetical protein CNEO3_1250002 [Clostridium neonatale]CAI3567785.1 hypothetical protein CNEO3_1250002 [Clostridium neonatale]DAF94573.1 MAG TPA: hypothetical protein [Siphoviridae sp. ct3gT1]